MEVRQYLEDLQIAAWATADFQAGKMNSKILLKYLELLKFPEFLLTSNMLIFNKKIFLFS